MCQSDNWTKKADSAMQKLFQNKTTQKMFGKNWLLKTESSMAFKEKLNKKKDIVEVGYREA